MEFMSKTVAGLQTEAFLLGGTSDFASAVDRMTFIRKVYGPSLIAFVQRLG